MIPRGLKYDFEAFKVKSYATLRLEFRIALADISYKDAAIGLDIAQYLQSLIDMASEGRTIAEISRSAAQSNISKQKRLLNSFERHQEIEQIAHEKKEIQRDENLMKRRQELKAILQKNVERLSSAKIKRSDKVNKSVQNIKQVHRTEAYLEELKRRSVEIKRQKEEVKNLVEEEKQKQKEQIWFIKKKKLKEFNELKVKQYSDTFAEMTRKREEQAKYEKQRQLIEAQKNSNRVQRVIQEHKNVLDYREKQKQLLANLQLRCKQIIDEDTQKQIFDDCYDTFRKKQDEWKVLKDPDLKVKLENKYATRLFTETGIVPKIISMTRMIEICRRSTKMQENPAYLTRTEFMRLFIDLAIDSSRSDLRNRDNSNESPRKLKLANTMRTVNEAKSFEEDEVVVDEEDSENILGRNMSFNSPFMNKTEYKAKMYASTHSEVTGEVGPSTLRPDGDYDEKITLENCSNMLELMVNLGVSAHNTF